MDMIFYVVVLLTGSLLVLWSLFRNREQHCPPHNFIIVSPEKPAAVSTANYSDVKLCCTKCGTGRRVS